MKTLMAKGFYIYGIRARSSAPIKTKGVEQKDVYTISHENIEAVISDVDLCDFEPESIKEKLKNLEWAESQVRAHAAVLDECMQTSSVIPWKFGTVFKSIEGLQKFLRENWEKLRDILKKFSDRQEWGIKIYTDTGVLRQEIRKTDDEIKKLEQEIASKSKGAGFFLGKKLENILTSKTEKKISQIIAEIFETLGQQAEEKVENRLLDRRLTGKETDMVLNAAFLIKKDRIDDFMQAIKKLKEEFRGSEFSLTGPWPPYNFVKF